MIKTLIYIWYTNIIKLEGFWSFEANNTKRVYTQNFSESLLGCFSTDMREENKYIKFDKVKQEAKRVVIQANPDSTTVKYDLVVIRVLKS